MIDLVDVFHFILKFWYIFLGLGIMLFFRFITRPKYSYHISMKFGMSDGGKYIMIWPMNSWGNYCTNRVEAIRHFHRLISNEPSSSFKLLRYTPVLDSLFRPVRIEGKPTELYAYEGQEIREVDGSDFLEMVDFDPDLDDAEDSEENTNNTISIDK